MATAPKRGTMTESEYLEWEARQDTKHEFVDGEVFAMSGASSEHDLIAANLIRHFGNHLSGTRCVVRTSDMKLRSPRGNYRYLDMSVECDIAGRDRNTHFVDEPVLVIETLSESTRKTDERDKPLEYFNIPSLQEYVLIEQDFVKVQVLRREQNWRADTYFLGDDIRLDSIDLDLPVEDVYERVETAELTEWRSRDAEGS